jgi:phage FluMu protein Com
MKKIEKIEKPKERLDWHKVANWKLLRCPNCMKDLIIQAFDFKENACYIKVACSKCDFDNFLIVSDKNPDQLNINPNLKSEPVLIKKGEKPLENKEKRKSYVG